MCLYQIKYIFFLIQLTSFWFYSCKTNTSSISTVQYDIVKYMNKELDKLQEEHPNISKKAILNGNEETIRNLAFTNDVKKDLIKAFTQCNINKAVLKDAYKNDTFWIQSPELETIEVINYLAKDSTLPVKWIQVYSNGDIKATFTESNPLYSLKRELYYKKNTLVSIYSVQQSLGNEVLLSFSEIRFAAEK